jgi:membrane-bound lytic murein transglycosylase B
MNARVKPLLLAALLASAALPALAQPAGGSAAAPCPIKAEGARPGPWHERMQARMQRRADELKAELKLSPEQEKAWSDYLAAMKPPADAQRPQHDELAKLPTPERLDRMRALHQQRDAAFERRAAATRAFYGTLNGEQKKVFDDRTASRHAGGRHRHYH